MIQKWSHRGIEIDAAVTGFPRPLSLGLLSRLKSCFSHRAVGSAGFYHPPPALDRRILYSALCGRNRLFFRSSQATSLLCLPSICRFPLGLISAEQSRSCGSLNQCSLHAFRARYVFFFSSRGRRNNLGCPPAMRKWVTDNPWTFTTGYYVDLLQGQCHKPSWLPPKSP